MAVYNLDKIENWYNDFVSIKNKFNNTYYDNYKSCYIKKCGDDVVRLMAKNLDKHYSKIYNAYNKINTAWKDYLNDLENTDRRLAGQSGSVNASLVSSKLSKLPSLTEYKRGIDVRIKSVSGTIGTAKGIGWSENRTLKENLVQFDKTMKSTGAVVATSVYSGILNLEESLVDGVLWCGTALTSAVVSMFDQEASEKIQNTMMDVISFDVVGEANKQFYENTELGRQINENSMIKYDSQVAGIIQDTSKKVAEFAAATALTVATGGLAAPLSALIVFGVGAVSGVGEKAEEVYQQDDRSFWGDTGEIVISGVISGVEWYDNGKIGANGLNAVKVVRNTIKSAGGFTKILGSAKGKMLSSFEATKTIISTDGVKGVFNLLKSKTFDGLKVAKSVFGKETLKKGFVSTFKDVDTYMDSISAAANNIKYDKENGLQVDWKGLIKETGCNFALNSVFGFIGSSFDLNNKSFDIDGSMDNVEEMPNAFKNPLYDSDLDFEVSKKANIIAPNNKGVYSDIEISDIEKEYNKLLDKIDTESADFANKLRLHSRGNFFEGSDEFAKNLDMIKEYEKQLGIPESKSVIPDVAKPFEWSNDKADFEQKLKAEKKPIYNYGESASPEQFLTKEINNANGFKVVQDITGGATADPNVAIVADEISKIDVNAKSINDNISNPDSNFIKVIKNQTKSTEINLKKDILSSINSDYDETQTIRKIYIELNKKTNYNVDFVLGDKNTQNAILNKVTTFDNVTNGNVVCKGWSELYAEALVEAGIDPSRVRVVKAQNAKHWWVEVDMGENIIRADATDAFLGSTDLANCKCGDSTNGFLILNKRDSGVRINNNILKENPNLLKNSNDYFRGVDESINYVDGDNGYFTENVNKLRNAFSNGDSPYGDIIKQSDILNKNVTSYMNMDIPENMNGYDAYAYYRKFSNTLFGNGNSNALPSLKKININGKDYSATVVELFDGNNEFYITFDEINGKKIYSREEYINGIMNNYKSFK